MDNRNILLAATVGAVVVVSSQVMAADICAGAGEVSTITGNTTNFVKADFVTRCSNNVFLSGEDGATNYFVKSYSSKGKTVYGGSTVGGKVTACSSFTTAPTGVQAAGTTNGCS